VWVCLRGLIIAICAGFALTVLAAMVVYGRLWPWLVLAAVAIPLLARASRPAGRPIVQAAVIPAAVQAPSQDVITRALGSLGIPGIDRWLKDERPLVFPSPVREDGPGWRAEVDLPFGVTAIAVIERRGLADGTPHRPVNPQGNRAHPGRPPRGRRP
jgi:S-DNA-T family DNA segregation ATPase FtsK/SpoIIIE